MQLIPVIDLMDGCVVHGQGGRRAEYRPLVSPLCASARPLDLAQTIRSRWGLSEFYLADLDAVMGKQPSIGVYETLQNNGFTLWVDAGLRSAADARLLATAQVATIVAGLETLSSPAVLAALNRQFGSERIVFSLDLKGGTPLGCWGGKQTSEVSKISKVCVLEIARQAVEAGAWRLLVLDLAQVGADAGTGTLELCRELKGQHPQIHLAAGGGVGGMEDIRKLESVGVDAVLVASALHDGRLVKSKEGWYSK